MHNCKTSLSLNQQQKITDMKNVKNLTKGTFQEDKNTVWTLTYLPTNKEWLIYCERNGEIVNGSKQFRKTINKEHKEMFNV